MACCSHAGYDDEPYHEYCCDCMDPDDRAEDIIRDVLNGEWPWSEPKPEDTAAAIRLALTLEDAL